jgi:antitoxin component YwqK of YwqJK toxin-antitoxin module
MKKCTIIVILCLCLINIVSAQEKCKYYLQQELDIVNEKWIETSTRQLANGLRCTFEYNGAVLMSGLPYELAKEFRKGNTEGLRLFSETPYKNGVMEGVSKKYHKSGKLSGESHYKNGKMIKSQHYYESGRLAGEMLFTNDETERTHVTYYESGKLLFQIPYKNGKMNGVAKYFYENGNLQHEVPYKDGKREGITRNYYENGTLNNEIQYKDGVKTGFAQMYYQSGKLAFKILYRNNEAINGTCGNGRQLTNAEIFNFTNNHPVYCE